MYDPRRAARAYRERGVCVVDQLELSPAAAAGTRPSPRADAAKGEIKNCRVMSLYLYIAGGVDFTV
jgi:hypothetical protein